MFLIVFYGIYLLIVIAASAIVFFRMRKRGPVPAVLTALAAVALLSLCYPIPIHGGFTFLFEVIVSEMDKEYDRFQQERTMERKESFQESLASRFRGRLEYGVVTRMDNNWTLIETTGGTRGWHDAGTALVWTDMLPLETNSAPSLRMAKELCSALPPTGHWALPTEAELVLFSKAGGYRLSPLGGYGTVGALEWPDTRTEMLTTRITRNGRYAVRCVALGPDAPRRGYSRDDLSLQEWNAYQISKSQPGFPDRGTH